jgi:hypothetical protein
VPNAAQRLANEVYPIQVRAGECGSVVQFSTRRLKMRLAPRRVRDVSTTGTPMNTAVSAQRPAKSVKPKWLKAKSTSRVRSLPVRKYQATAPKFEKRPRRGPNRSCEQELHCGPGPNDVLPAVDAV